jgi:hypothetical protein
VTNVVSAATQIYYASFDAVFLKLPVAVRARIEAKIDEIGLRLRSFLLRLLSRPSIINEFRPLRQMIEYLL